MRKNILKECYTDVLIKMREEIGDHPIWISIETTDISARKVTNTIIGTLHPDKSGKTFLLDSDVLEKANNETIVKLFKNSLINCSLKICGQIA